MRRYELEKEREGSTVYFFFRDVETLDIVLLPTKYLMHKIRSKCSPNTVRRSALAILYYLEYIHEKKKELTDVYQMPYVEQTNHFVEFLYWLKAGKHTRDKNHRSPNNGTCNAYLRDVFRFYLFIEEEYQQFGELKVLSYNYFVAVDAVGVKKSIRSKSFKGYLKEEEHKARAAKKDEIVEILKACTNIRDRLLMLLLAETGYRIGEILGYELRKKFESYITPLIKQKYLYRYTGTFDRIRQSYIRVRMKTPAGQRECEWKYKNEILFVPYHSDPVIVKSVETVRCRSNMVWNFKAAASEKLKRQIFTVLEYILENYEISRLREYKLTGLQLFYEFCIREQITDIQLLELEQETAFQDYLKQKVEKEQRRKRLKSIVETARKVIFIETDETRWDATIWYLERFRIAKERINQSDSIEKISFQEVLQPKNRLLLQEYMKYEIGIGELALSTVYERFRTIRNFLQEISELEVTKCDASLIDVYLKNLQNGAMGAKTFNTNVSGIQFFMKFLEVKGYIKKVPFYASYYLEKQIPVHHDRSVEEDVYMEIIQNLSQFPEHLRMMFLHLWCVGLRISEVCTLKGDAYYIQNGDCWMKVYQVKMKNYKRVPIPVTLYRLM